MDSHTNTTKSEVCNNITKKMVKSKLQTFVQIILILAALILIGINIVGNVTQDISIKQTLTLVLIIGALVVAWQFLKSAGPETLRVEDFIGLAFAGGIVIIIFIFALPALGPFSQTGLFSQTGITQTEQLIRGALGEQIIGFLETNVGIITILAAVIFIWRDNIVKIRRKILN